MFSAEDTARLSNGGLSKKPISLASPDPNQRKVRRKCILFPSLDSFTVVESRALTLTLQFLLLLHHLYPRPIQSSHIHSRTPRSMFPVQAPLQTTGLRRIPPAVAVAAAEANLYPYHHIFPTTAVMSRGRISRMPINSSHSSTNMGPIITTTRGQRHLTNSVKRHLYLRPKHPSAPDPLPFATSCSLALTWTLHLRTRSQSSHPILTYLAASLREANPKRLLKTKMTWRK